MALSSPVGGSASAGAAISSSSSACEAEPGGPTTLLGDAEDAAVVPAEADASERRPSPPYSMAECANRLCAGDGWMPAAISAALICAWQKVAFSSTEWKM